MVDSPLHVLLVEDSDADARLVAEALSLAGRFRLTRTCRLDEAIQTLARESFDVVVLDLTLPDSDGMDSYGALQLYSPNVPVVILTGVDDREMALAAVKAGAQDFLPKSEILSPSTPRALRYAVERHRIMGELRRACLAAEAANQAKNAFLTRMSHELRTPLNGILGNTELAMDMEAARGVRDCLRTIRKCGTDLLALVDDILDYSHIEARDVRLEVAPFHLRDLLCETMHAMATAAWSKRLELSYRVEDGIPDDLVGDARRLRQILVNLVDNAIKFTDHGEVYVEVGADWTSDQELLLHVAVTDTGVGIPEGQREALFEAFAQGDESTSRRHGGSGLGLTISTRLAEMMGGRVWVSCDLEQGSQFHFTARLGLPDRPPVAKPDGFGPGTHVLLVDDNPRCREIVEHMLGARGVRVTSSATGPDAQRALHQGAEFSAVMIDTVLPGMSGWVLARRLLTEGGCPPLILLLADPPRRRARHLTRMGVAGMLRKPVSESELCAALRDALSRPRKTRRVSSGCVPMRILLAEDNIVNQTLTVQMLQRAGHSVGVASNGLEALRMLEQGRWDLVLMDLEMPEMDGLEATRAIRAREESGSGHIPVLALTAHGLPPHREACQQAGMDDFLVKPVGMADLLAAVQRHAPEAPAGRLQPPCPPADVLDEAMLISQVDGDADLLLRLIRLFADSAPRNMRGIREALDTGNLEAVTRVAHELGGSIANFQARPALAAARRLESLARNGTSEGIEDAYRELEAQVRRLQEALPAVVVRR